MKFLLLCFALQIIASGSTSYTIRWPDLFQQFLDVCKVRIIACAEDAPYCWTRLCLICPSYSLQALLTLALMLLFPGHAGGCHLLDANELRPTHELLPKHGGAACFAKAAAAPGMLGKHYLWVLNASRKCSRLPRNLIHRDASFLLIRFWQARFCGIGSATRSVRGAHE